MLLVLHGIAVGSWPEDLMERAGMSRPGNGRGHWLELSPMNNSDIQIDDDGDCPIVCICGASASGKSHFAHLLVSQFEAVGLTSLLLQCDNYYRCAYAPDPIYGFDTIDAIDVDALLADLHAARQGTLTRLRQYDMGSRAVGYRPIDESFLSARYDLIVVEGAYGPQAILSRVLIDAVVYLETPLWRRVIRRLPRDVRARGRSPMSVLNQMLWQMLPGERRFIVPLRQQADVVVRDPVEGYRAVLARITGHG